MQIETNKPLPPTKVGRPAKYPMAEMNIGDSFFSLESRNRLNAVCQYQRLQHGKRFTVRSDGGGYRVWRTA